ncbi:hypothetical protein [Streptomyces beijiangensis]|uniref:Uncharacterized protein n=1 Tax=Streptomyces beijiangensis TaxID=163361 RepID=A0A939JCZ4_9ACTN|nr:hypothetical protein [Streptomyces beijiangensis]MBO0511501.1 hypothetical protein [Streptomyces beijiangensis]
MPQHVSIVQQVGLAVLLLATVAWIIGLVRILRRDRFAVSVWRTRQPLRTVPVQRGHSGERVELTPAERDAFAGLVRQLAEDRS